jgi:hypothetical protein
VVAAANPLRGLTSDSDYVRAVLQTIRGPVLVVLVRRAVISNAAAVCPT